MSYGSGKLDAVRNKNGIWINTSVFREAALHFQKYGYYNADPPESPDWKEYWLEEKRRCIRGYSVGGVWITGDHYFYLNYCPIRKLEDAHLKQTKGKKVTTFPDFWDGDYNYFIASEIALNGILENFVKEKERKRILSLEDYARLDALDTIVKSLNLEVKIPTHSILKRRNRPDQIQDHLLGGKNMIIGKARRRGYEQPHSEIIMTDKGKSTMGKIAVGEYVLTPNGTKTKVTAKYFQGLKCVYELELYDGRKVKCGLNHLWKIYSGNFNKKTKDRYFKILSTEDILKSSYKEKGVYKHYIKINEPISNADDLKDLPLPPYVVGAFLGDGNMIRQTRLSGIDEDIHERVLKEVSEKFKDLEIKIIRRVRYWEYSFLTRDIEHFRLWRDRYNYKKVGTARINPLYKEFEKLGINCHGNNKYIPDVYKYNSTISERYALVQGLMDTDGTVSEDGSMSFAGNSERLVSDLQEVLYSLGIGSTKRVRKDGLHIIYINTNEEIVYLKRKKVRLKKYRKCRKYIPIINIKKLGYKELSSCIEVEDEEHLYLTRGYVTTHNSYKAASEAVNTYFTKPESLSIFGAYESRYLYPKGLFTMTLNYINFINKNTGWAMPSDKVNRQDSIKASYVEYNKDGQPIELGYKSNIIALSFKDNADAARGKDADKIKIEEAGAFGRPGLLKASYKAMKPCVMAGQIQTGIITIFGCVMAGTKVWDNKGVLTNIEDITKEKGIIGYASKGVMSEEITWLKPPGKKECVKITTSKGESISCSLDHPLLWTKRWYKKGKNKAATFKRAEDVKVGDILLQTLQMPKFGQKRIWKPYLVGLLIGDGYYGQNSSPQIAISEPELLTYLDESETSYSIYKGKSSEIPYFRYVTLKGSQKELRLLGIYGQTKKSKRLPSNIWQYKKEDVCELLAGYFDADGNISAVGLKKCIKLTSVVKKLLEEVKTQLFKLGISSNIYKRDNKKSVILKSNVTGKTSTIKRTISYSLEICDIKSLRNFKKHIKLKVKKKKNRINSWDLQKRRNEKITDYEYLHTIEKGDFFIENNKLQNLIGRKVLKVEKLGLQNVYNLSTKYTHTYLTNNFISHNTSGDMEGGTYDFADMHSNPLAYNLLAFENIWDEDLKGTKCGFFHPISWNLEGYYDKQGNSKIEEAKQNELDIREDLKANGADSTALQEHMQEFPLSPSEAFGAVSVNNFPILELKKRLAYVKANDLQNRHGIPVKLNYTEDGIGIKMKVILDGTANPITSWINLPKDQRGCVMIYEPPVVNPPRGLYKIGYDPVRQNQGTSLAAIIVYKGVHRNSAKKNIIVAEFIGRRDDTDKNDEIAAKLAIFYNTTIMHENEVTGVVNYFKRNKKLRLLATQPDGVISKSTKNSKVARTFGCHMSKPLKDAGERYIKTWLIQVLDHDEEGKKITTIDKINSIRLLEELIHYREGNFDLISALIMCLFQVQEEVLGKVYDNSNANNKLKDLEKMSKNIYKRDYDSYGYN